MKNRYSFVILWLVAFNLICPIASAGNAETVAVTTAQQWLSLIDTGKYDQSWETAAALFKNAIAKAQWHQTIAAVRQPMGKLISRDLTTATYTTALPGAPDGEYVVIQFRSSFGNKKSAIETITPMKDPDGAWRVSGYFIK